MNAPICIQWRSSPSGPWETFGLLRLPIAYAVKIRFDFSPAPRLTHPQSIIDRTKALAAQVGGQVLPQAPQGLVEPGTNENLLEILISDGQTPCPLDPRISAALVKQRSNSLSTGQTWVLPMMPAGASPQLFPDDVQRQNIAFWHHSIDELALTALARAGATSLERRVFISYRRVDTEPMAHQLRQALETLNFDVFLDSVTVDPGINFQDRLFEQLADKSMVVLLHSETFSNSKWTMAEINYARDHELSLLILRLPTVPDNDPLDPYYRAGDVLRLKATDLAVPDGALSNEVPNPKPPHSLTAASLQRLVQQITEQHDLEMISRLAVLRSRTLESLAANNVTYRESDHGTSIYAEAASTPKSYRLFPGSRPPGLKELYGASTFKQDVGDHRIVVGHISSFHPDRLLQMDWTVDGRNVSYADVSMLDYLAREIKAGRI